MLAYAPSTHRRGRVGHFLAPILLAGLVAGVVLVVLNPPVPIRVSAPALAPPHVVVHRLPRYWIVKPGDTYAQIAARTGLSIAQLEAYNPAVDPFALIPGERLKLWSHYPKPRPKPRPSRFWLVRPGQSFGSIAARTRISIITLESLNPRIKPASLQPGDRVRLRR